MMCEPELR